MRPTAAGLLFPPDPVRAYVPVRTRGVGLKPSAFEMCRAVSEFMNGSRVCLCCVCALASVDA